SPAGDLLAIQVAPGGGMNTQIWLLRPDGSGLRRITPGGKDNNWLGGFTRDGGAVLVASNRRVPESMDGYLSPASGGEARLVSKSDGIGGLEDVSRDGRLALASRLQRSDE